MLSSSCRLLARRQRFLANTVFQKRGQEEARRHLSTFHGAQVTSFHKNEADGNPAQRQRYLLRSLPSSSFAPPLFVPDSSLTFLLGQSRWNSTTNTSSATPSSGSENRHLSSATSESLTNDDNEKEKSSLDKISKNARHRADEIRENARHRAEEMRDNAREHYREFKEHPQEKAVKGAKTAGEMIRLYGPVFIGTYGTIYVSTLGLFFVGVQSGVLDPAVLLSWLGDSGAVGAEESKNTVSLVVDFLNSHALTKSWATFVEKNPSVANLAVAWIAVKFTEPVRMVLAFAVTPRVARYIGWTVKDEGEEEDTPVDNKKR